MPFPKNVRGGHREKSGRPNEKGVGANGRGLNVEERNSYFREKMAESRQQETAPQAIETKKER